MRCLILGGDGMLGHRLFQELREHDVRVTLRGPMRDYRWAIFSAHNTFDHVDVRDTQRLIEVFSEFRPEAVINAVGVVKQRREASDPSLCIEVNALLPHRLATLCNATGARLIHVSTDCVFSGEQGNYTEEDPADAVDLYGRTKHLGEVTQEPALTLRTSIIGLELKNYTSLIEWFLRQQGTVRGYRQAIYSGVTTLELSRLIRHILETHPDLHGLWHVASQPISKYDLLVTLREKLGRRDIRLVPDNQFVCDRSLDGAALLQRIGYRPPSWDLMLEELAVEIRHRTRGLNCYDAA